MAGISDLDRWEQSNQRKLEILTRRLGSLATPRCDPQGVDMLHLTFINIAFTRLAANDLDGARSALLSSVESQMTIQQWACDGEPRALGYRSPGFFPTLLHAHLLNDSRLTKRIASLMNSNIQASNSGPEDSTYIANLCLMLTLGESSGIVCDLAHPPATCDKMFHGYIPTLLSLFRTNVEGFRLHLCDAARNWVTYTAKHFAGNPRSVCFLDAAGIIMMARTLKGYRLEDVPECISRGLLTI
jgi:hypothetical protein